jgi:hypothetical protein
MNRKAVKGFKDLIQRRIQSVVDRLKETMGGSAIELLQMNKGKRGRPYRYSDTEIVNASAFRFLMKMGLRQTMVLVKNLAGKCASYSQLDRRLASIGLKWIVNRVKRKGRIISIDGSGIAINYRSDYRSSKYHVKQRFYKLHAEINSVTKKLLDYRLTSDRIGDNTEFLPMMKETASKGDTVCADGAYDAKENFNYLDKKGIKALIRIRRNFSLNSKGSYARRKAIAEQFGINTHRLKGRIRFLPTNDITFDKRMYYQDKWRRNSGYDVRTSVERFFSAFKALFGGYASSRKLANVRKEMLIKCITYNRLLEIK